MLKAFVQGKYDVTFLPLEPALHARYNTKLRAMGVAVLPARPMDGWTLQDANGKCMFDVILIARLPILRLVYAKIKQKCPDTDIIFDSVDLHFFREVRTYLAKNMVEWDFDKLAPSAVMQWLECGKL